MGPSAWGGKEEQAAICAPQLMPLFVLCSRFLAFADGFLIRHFYIVHELWVNCRAGGQCLGLCANTTGHSQNPKHSCTQTCMTCIPALHHHEVPSCRGTYEVRCQAIWLHSLVHYQLHKWTWTLKPPYWVLYKALQSFLHLALSWTDIVEPDSVDLHDKFTQILQQYVRLYSCTGIIFRNDIWR